MDKEPVLIGMGSRERCDDGVGPFVAAQLAERGLRAVTHEGDGAGLLDLWEAEQSCIILDAVAGGSPGEIRVFRDLGASTFTQAGFVRSTHQIGLAEGIALARALDRLPTTLLVIGVSGSEFGFGTSLSLPVAEAADRLVRRFAAMEDWGALFVSPGLDQTFT